MNIKLIIFLSCNSWTEELEAPVTTLSLSTLIIINKKEQALSISSELLINFIWS